MFRVNFKGAAALGKAVKDKGGDYPLRVKRALVRGAERIMARSKDEFVPVDLGALKNTGAVIPDPNPKVVAVTLSYGDTAVEYAVEQHENMQFRHTVGGPKYLERPMNEAVPNLLADIAREEHL